MTNLYKAIEKIESAKTLDEVKDTVVRVLKAMANTIALSGLDLDLKQEKYHTSTVDFLRKEQAKQAPKKHDEPAPRTPRVPPSLRRLMDDDKKGNPPRGHLSGGTR